MTDLYSLLRASVAASFWGRFMGYGSANFIKLSTGIAHSSSRKNPLNDPDEAWPRLRKRWKVIR